MTDLRIEKSRYPVVVTMLGGARLVGEVFVQSVSRYHAGPEEPRDVLNATDPFFPLATEGGEVLLVAKDFVRDVETQDSLYQDPLERAGLMASVVELTLADGGRVSGAVLLSAAAGRERLLDSLNANADRFIAVYMTTGARLVNRRLVLHVRPLD
ncbi:MAG TPA: hypothetical protein VNA89_07410 [Gemmatimonadaceae bacterium]|nr:hypothetical protein [Gemmatimonadaceae bacterium]